MESACRFPLPSRQSMIAGMARILERLAARPLLAILLIVGLVVATVFVCGGLVTVAWFLTPG